MCGFGLTNTDFKAICAARGFPAKYASARVLFEHVFLSGTGVAQVLAKLNSEQLLLLHLMDFLGDEVDVTFFARIYPAANRNSWNVTFNKRYKIVFDKVRTDFIRRGILMFAQNVQKWDKKETLLERQRFQFPAEFALHLPSFISAKNIANPKILTSGANILREKLAEICSPQPRKEGVSTPGRLHINDGWLLMDKSPFTKRLLQSWKITQWMNNFKVLKGESTDGISLRKLLGHFLAGPDENPWFVSSDLTPLLEMAFPEVKLPETEKICAQGWQTGCLDKTIADNKTCYRLNDDESETEPLQPGDFLSALDLRSFTIDLDKIPFSALEILAGICRLKVSGTKLVGEADFVRLSHCLSKIEHEPVFTWLTEHLEEFGRTAKNIVQRQNRTIIHDNILIAKITDLSLKILIEKKLAESGDVLSPSDEFIVFPLEKLPEIEKTVKKAGHVIKTIVAD